MAQLMDNVPHRPVYQIGLLLLRWQDMEENWLSALVSVVKWIRLWAP